MMLKVNDEYLDFNEVVEVEKQIKLLEDISTTDGDFSYSFSLPRTINNVRILGNPQPDNISKLVYQRIPAILMTDGGEETFKGYIGIERLSNVITCSFFAGNNNWFGALIGQMSDLRLDIYDVENTVANIQASWDNKEGLVFSLFDAGGLLTRAIPQLKIEDFVGGFYVKTLFERIFSEAGIKIQGELLEDWMFQNAVCVKNSKDNSEIDARTSYVHKTTPQHPADFPDPPEVVTWDNDSSFPYFDGSQNNFSLVSSRYTADIKMVVTVTVFLKAQGDGGSPEIVQANIVKNGSDILYYGTTNALLAPTYIGTINMDVTVPLDAGEYIDITAQTNAIVGTSAADIIEGTIKVTPIFLYSTYGRSAVPNWTKQDFVSNILRLFNVLASFNEATRVLTLNLFEKIKSKEPLDLSQYLSTVDVDYSEFISDYGKRSLLGYTEVEFDELKSYNSSEYFKYGQGVIDVNNDFISEEENIIESEFANPIAYINGIFDASLERTNLVELDEDESLDLTSVSLISTVTRFNVPEEIFFVGDLVRVESTNPTYNGDWRVSAVNSGWIELTGAEFDTDATGTITKLNYVYSSSDDVYLFVNIPSYPISNFSGNDSVFFEDQVVTSIALSYFNLIHTGRSINSDFIYSLAFGTTNHPLAYQIGLIEQYFKLFSRVLNDPVKLMAEGHLPHNVFTNIDFLRPILIRTEESTNTYYLNRVSGYKESFMPCNLELIKI